VTDVLAIEKFNIERTKQGFPLSRGHCDQKTSGVWGHASPSGNLWTHDLI